MIKENPDAINKEKYRINLEKLYEYYEELIALEDWTPQAFKAALYPDKRMFEFGSKVKNKKLYHKRLKEHRRAGRKYQLTHPHDNYMNWEIEDFMEKYPKYKPIFVEIKEDNNNEEQIAFKLTTIPYIEGKDLSSIYGRKDTNVTFADIVKANIGDKFCSPLPDQKYHYTEEAEIIWKDNNIALIREIKTKIKPEGILEDTNLFHVELFMDNEKPNTINKEKYKVDFEKLCEYYEELIELEDWTPQVFKAALYPDKHVFKFGSKDENSKLYYQRLMKNQADYSKNKNYWNYINWEIKGFVEKYPRYKPIFVEIKEDKDNKQPKNIKLTTITYTGDENSLKMCWRKDSKITFIDIVKAKIGDKFHSPHHNYNYSYDEEAELIWKDWKTATFKIKSTERKPDGVTEYVQHFVFKFPKLYSFFHILILALDSIYTKIKSNN